MTALFVAQLVDMVWFLPALLWRSTLLRTVVVGLLRSKMNEAPTTPPRTPLIRNEPYLIFKLTSLRLASLSFLSCLITTVSATSVGD